MTLAPPPGPPTSGEPFGGFDPGGRLPRSGMALASMILGILGILLGIVVIGVVLGIVGLILGILALGPISRGMATGKGMAITGIVLGSLSILFVPFVLLAAILLPSLGKARELANRGTCAANVRGIAQSMHVYGADNNDVYPIVAAPASNSPARYKLAADAQAPGFKSVDDTFKSIYQTSPQTNAGSPLASLWILCIRGDVAPKQFLCKSDQAGGMASSLINAAGTYNTNFNDPGNVANSDLRYSYSIAYPWTAKDAGSAAGGWWKATSDASIPLMADMSPLTGTPAGASASTPGVAFSTVTKFANSVNHQRDGQNISFGDAHAEFQRSPFIGQNGDNIYTVGRSGPSYPSNSSNPITTSGMIPAVWTGGSSGSYDTIMVPAANAVSHARF